MNCAGKLGLICLAPLFLALLRPSLAAGQTIVDHTSTRLQLVPSDWIARAASSIHVAYNHTSHGSHIISGMRALENFPPYGNVYRWSDDGSVGLDLDDEGIPCTVPDLSRGDYVDEHGVTPWVTCTREFLNDSANSHVNVIMWSWCSIYGHDAQRYVDNLETLIAEYPAVRFVFMTGHAQGQGEDMRPNSVHYNNEMIRSHCRNRRRILFDFADIEAYDPDGRYFWDQMMWDNLSYSGGNWALEWITANAQSVLTKLTTGQGVEGYPGVASCAHSNVPQEANLNCVLKGRAVWWLFARLAGWDGNPIISPLRPNGRRVPLGYSSLRN